ncbi:MAG: hypothetical protein SGPRY_007019 [Prymnesium sp.]
MRVLVVLAFKDERKARASAGETLAERFVRQIKALFNEKLPGDTLKLVTRRVDQLGDFIPSKPPSGVPSDIPTVRKALAILDGVDFVFIDGDDNFRAWTHHAVPLLQLLQLCAMSSKCVFGCGCAVQVLAYLSMVGCKSVPLLNRSNTDSLLRQPQRQTAKSAFMATDASVEKQRAQEPSMESGSVSNPRSAMLERHTGDLFRYDEARRAWEVVSNIGVHTLVGAPTNQEQRMGDGLNRSVGVGLCAITTLARFHFLFKDVWPANFPVSQVRSCRMGFPTCQATS